MSLEACELFHKVDEKLLFSNASLRLSVKESVVLLGANGSGKSTILRLLLGLQAPLKGEVLLDGKRVLSLSRKALAKKVAYVAQKQSLSFDFSVFEVVLQGLLPNLGFFKSLSLEDEAKVLQALKNMEVEHLYHKKFACLSGGEAKKVLIARALAQDTPYILLDEPTNNLDFGSQVKLIRLLKKISKTKGVLSVLHNPYQARELATRVLTLKNKELQSINPLTVDKPFINKFYDL